MKQNAYPTLVSYSKRLTDTANVSDEHMYTASGLKAELLNINFLRPRIGDFILICILHVNRC
jgi:hypothetical protein